MSEKKSKPVGYTRTLYLQTGENTKWAETFVWCLLLIFKVVYQDFLCMGFRSERAAAGLGPSGLNLFTFLPCILSKILSFKLQNILCISPKQNYCQDSPEVWSILMACLIPQLCNFVAISFCPKCKRLGSDTVPSSDIQANEAWITFTTFSRHSFC